MSKHIHEKLSERRYAKLIHGVDLLSLLVCQPLQTQRQRRGFILGATETGQKARN